MHTYFNRGGRNQGSYRLFGVPLLEDEIFSYK